MFLVQFLELLIVSEKGGRADFSSSGLPATKKSRQSSTRPGTQVIGSVLLGEHINMFCLFVVCLCL